MVKKGPNTMKVIATPDRATNDEFIAALLGLIQENGWGENVKVEYVVPKLSKSEKIVIAAEEIADNGEFMNRNDLAAKIDCTVSLISATFKENADNAGVIGYLAMEKEFRAAKKAHTAQQNLLKTLMELQQAGTAIDLSAFANVIPMVAVETPATALTGDSSESPKEITATEEVVDLTASSVSEETPVVSITSAPKRNSRKTSA